MQALKLKITTISLCSLLIAFIYGNISKADNTEVSLKTKPSRCVALRQGQVCYQKVTLNWQAEVPGDYCLFEENSNSLLQCWSQSTSGKVKIPFKSDKDIRFTLRQKSTQRILTEATVIVAWVYKTSKQPRSSWRLF